MSMMKQAMRFFKPTHASRVPRRFNSSSSAQASTSSTHVFPALSSS